MARRFDPAGLREVHQIAPRDPFNKMAFYDPQRGALRPNLVFVQDDGEVVFETNEVGLKGDPLDPNRRLAVVWGDSVVFSAGRGWPCLLDQLAPGYQFLNGGIEGDPFRNILRRAAAFNRRHRVALNLVMPGWHPLLLDVARALGRGGNETVRADLTAFLREFPNTVVLTVPTALSEDNVEQVLVPFIRDGDDDTCFRFLGDYPAKIEWQRVAFEHIQHRNAIVREVCRESGHRVIDLFAALSTRGAADFRRDFVDIMHFRGRAHRPVAEIVFAAMTDLLAPAGEA